jgi:hypothetical protein
VISTRQSRQFPVIAQKQAVLDRPEGQWTKRPVALEELSFDASVDCVGSLQ